MEMFEWIRFIIGAVFLLISVVAYVVEMIGIFRFRYVMNRMHAAAIGDTLGIGSAMIGLIIMNGIDFTSLKLFCVVVFLWFASPVCSHLIARLEYTTDEDRKAHYEVVDLDQKGGKEA